MLRTNARTTTPYSGHTIMHLTIQWFVILLWGIVVSTQPPAITSYLNALGLGPEYYGQALHGFHSSGFRIDGLY